jgi:hypothetical protein
MKDGANVTIAGIVILGLMESVAIATGQDGAYFGPVVAAIAGLAGYHARPHVDKRIKAIRK